MKFFWRAILFWILFIPVAIINGMVRNSIYQPIIGELRGHQLSAVIFSILFIAYSYLFIKTHKYKLVINDSIKIGFLWLILTILFEFIFGHFIVGHTWEKLLYDYNLMEGRVWIFVLLIITIAPSIVLKINQKTISNH